MVPVTMPTTAPTRLKLRLHLLHPLPIAAHNIPDMPDPIKIHLQLVNLPQDIMEPRYLRVRNRNRVARPVVLLLRDCLRLLREPIEPGLDLLHEAIKVPTQRSERVPVEEEQAL